MQYQYIGTSLELYSMKKKPTYKPTRIPLPHTHNIVIVLLKQYQMGGVFILVLYLVTVRHSDSATS